MPVPHYLSKVQLGGPQKAVVKKQQPPEHRQRPAGTGRKARRRRREQARQAGGTLLKAPMLRGHTAAGRLRLLDSACSCIRAPLFQPPQLPMEDRSGGVAEWSWKDSSAADASGGIAVDVGVGDSPVTTMEMAANLQLGDLPGSCRGVIGTEADEGRLKTARQKQKQQQQQGQAEAAKAAALEFRLGGTDFALPLAPTQRPVLIRAMNVLRDYHQRDAADALRRLHSRLAPGGLLCEGSSSSTGDLLVAALFRGRPELPDRADLEIEAVVFAADLSSTDIDSMVPPPVWFARHLPRIWLGCWPTPGGDDCNVHNADDGAQTIKPHLRGGTGRVADTSDTALSTTPPCSQAVQAFLQAWERASTRKAQEASTCRGAFAQSVQQLSADLAAQRGTCRLLASSVVEVAWADNGIVVWVPGAKMLSLAGSASAVTATS